MGGCMMGRKEKGDKEMQKYSRDGNRLKVVLKKMPGCCFYTALEPLLYLLGISKEQIYQWATQDYH